MANIKSSKKDIKRIRINTRRNRSRLSEIKTLTKKLDGAVKQNDSTQAESLFREVQAKIARAEGKGVLKANTASRKISGAAKKLKSLLALE